MRTGADALADSADGHRPAVDLRYTSPLVQVGHAREATGPDFSFPCQAADAMSAGIPRVYLRYTPAAMQAR